MRKSTLAVAAAAASFLSPPASAQTLQFSFAALAGPGASFSFTADSSPSPVLAQAVNFELQGVDVNLGGTTDIEDVNFWENSGLFAGGLTGYEPGTSIVIYNLFGPQLFTGPLDAPTFLTGSFDLHSQGPAGPLAGTLTISPVRGVPEPATWAMMLLGFCGIGLAMRFKRREVRHA